MKPSGGFEFGADDAAPVVQHAEERPGDVEVRAPERVLDHLGLLLGVHLRPGLALLERLGEVVAIAGGLRQHGIGHVAPAAVLVLPDVDQLVDDDMGVLIWVHVGLAGQVDRVAQGVGPAAVEELGEGAHLLDKDERVVDGRDEHLACGLELVLVEGALVRRVHEGTGGRTHRVEAARSPLLDALGWSGLGFGFDFGAHGRVSSRVLEESYRRRLKAGCRGRGKSSRTQHPRGARHEHG